MIDRLYPILDADLCRARRLEPLAVLAAFLDGGARFIQLRDKHPATGARLALADAALALTRAAGARLVINDRPDIARLAGADGVHVGQEDLSVEDVRLVDRSRLYTNYAMNPGEVTAAINRLNEQLKLLPDDVPCSLEGLYPDFDDPDTDAYAYMAMLRLEIRDTEQDIELVGYDNAEPLRRLLTMLRECASALERAGVVVA